VRHGEAWRGKAGRDVARRGTVWAADGSTEGQPSLLSSQGTDVAWRSQVGQRMAWQAVARHGTAEQGLQTAARRGIPPCCPLKGQTWRGMAQYGLPRSGRVRAADGGTEGSRAFPATLTKGGSGVAGSRWAKCGQAGSGRVRPAGARYGL